MNEQQRRIQGILDRSVLPTAEAGRLAGEIVRAEAAEDHARVLQEQDERNLAEIVALGDRIAAARELAVGHEDHCRPGSWSGGCNCRRGAIRVALGGDR